jgi:IS1 family transposase
MTGRSKGAVLRFIAEMGQACSDYQDTTLRNLRCRRIQCDEIWSVYYTKQRNVPEAPKGTFGLGDVWTWTAIDADTKLVPSWLVSSRDADAAQEFMNDLRDRLMLQFQLTTDGHAAYLEAVENSFGGAVSYAQLIKMYGAAPENTNQVRYSPSECIGTRTEIISGDPDKSHISTSYIERQNLTMRMSMGRFTRLTNGFSKKVENHAHAVSLHFMWYNFARVHKSLKGKTPAMAAGVADHVWTAEEVAGLLDSK